VQVSTPISTEFGAPHAALVHQHIAETIARDQRMSPS
jgi:hypothetical protein